MLITISMLEKSWHGSFLYKTRITLKKHDYKTKQNKPILQFSQAAAENGEFGRVKATSRKLLIITLIICCHRFLTAFLLASLSEPLFYYYMITITGVFLWYCFDRESCKCLKNKQNAFTRLISARY